MNSLRILCFLGLSLCLYSCSGDRLYEDYISVNETSGWNQYDSLSFVIGDLPIQDKKPIIGIRFTENYPFSNFYMRVISKDSTGQITENRLINIPLFDSKSGEPLGTGFGSTYTKFDTMPFQLKEGTQSIVLLQYMRQENLPGIESAGIKILK
ncbi:MAG TPA: gliding motility lipoprotein GldH [Algoriphagus sp.]|jgi:gliding motility-associated lipoprotein GldH|uniref:Gliding motility-associated lipoprotein GldH n=1 Tax=Algoriphagus ornithinivorans TaxID=226506 RepID=A0A1I5AJV6_9BACT|nr:MULTISPECIES: gliding motility lipoprotein GldH [Algoriphagus]MAL12816.1 gliding motility lipoprotein GldH [Algoriphagus sp.]MAN88996.1 gliding motility lipoprotein GldH [Algoriphagus sp.]QYH39616.1 gliding motility lipoprotein GldH [Algoriphagus sp. NBT04N3]SFN62786.1 gliding motility-associated lipoprotein GldH [Algoriphagus ornithinivorans]HAH37352.1 gliding motility lipoprotein GldH [Algoriphagus sp.]|tara:strand:- start:1171 stop:1629 length:459 start_codon:yes stop_codon:yes gene_type:complete